MLFYRAMAFAAAMATASVACPVVRASWDLNPSPKIVNPNSTRPPKPTRLPRDQVAAPTGNAKENLLAASRFWDSGRGRAKTEQPRGHLNYKRWLPIPPKVSKPRSIYNAASLAFLGDCIYELYARRHFLSPVLAIDAYNEKVISIVRCEAQDALLKKLLGEDYLTEDERDVIRWGKNIGSSKSKKRASVAVHRRASSLETLIGYLYLTDVNRLHSLMYKLGFLTKAITEKSVGVTPPS